MVFKTTISEAIKRFILCNKSKSQNNRQRVMPAWMNERLLAKFKQKRSAFEQSGLLISVSVAIPILYQRYFRSIGITDTFPADFCQFSIPIQPQEEIHFIIQLIKRFCDHFEYRYGTPFGLLVHALRSAIQTRFLKINSSSKAAQLAPVVNPRFKLD